MKHFPWSRWLTRLLGTPRTRRRPGRRSLAVPALETLEGRITPTTYTWQGGAGSLWSKGSNWVGGVAPTSATTADQLVFGTAAQVGNRSTQDDIAGLNIGALTISASGYTLTATSGTTLTLGSTAGPTGGGGLFSIGGSSGLTAKLDTSFTLALGAGSSNLAQDVISVGSGATLTIAGHLVGKSNAELISNGVGTLVLQADNSGGGTPASAMNGPIDVQAGTLSITNAKALGIASLTNTVRVEFGATLQVDNSNNTLNPGVGIQQTLLLNGAGTSGQGALYYNNISGGQATSNSATWAGPIVLDSNTTLGADGNAGFNAANGVGLGTLTISGVISDSSTGHNLTKEGTGEIILTGTNTYRGSTTINNGILAVGSNWGLGHAPFNGGASNADNQLDTATIVNSTLTKTGTLELDGGLAGGSISIANQLLVLNSPVGINPPNLGPDGSVVDNIRGINTWAGNTLLNGASAIAVGAFGPGNVAPGSASNSSLVFGGINPLTGIPTTILQGSVTGASGAGASPIIITTTSTAGLVTGETVHIDGVSGETAANALGWTITVISSTQFSLNGSTGNGTYSGPPGLWRLGVVSGPAPLVKVGNGIVEFTTDNTYTGTTTINGGILQIETNGALGLGSSGTFVLPLAPWTGATLELADDFRIANNIAPINQLTILNFLSINGPGYSYTTPTGTVVNLGALYSNSGINTYTGTVVLNGAAGIGVDPPPSPTAAPYTYDVTSTGTALDDSLTITSGGIQGGALSKFGQGQLILPTANRYTGGTTIGQGWITVENSSSLGVPLVARGQAVEPPVTVAAGAALHLLSLSATPVNEQQTITFSGITGGTFELNLNGGSSTAGPITWSNNPATLASNIQNALNALPNIGPTGTTVTPLTVNATGDTTSGSVVISNLPSTSGLAVGMVVTGTGIPANTTIAAINSPNQITLSSAATATAANVPLVFTSTNVTVTFSGPLVQNTYFVPMTGSGAAGSLTGTNPTITVTTTTAGSAGPINLLNNLTLAGNGVTLPSYPLVNQQGALMNLDGSNTVTGNVVLNGQVGVGVEQVYQNSVASYQTVAVQGATGGTFTLTFNGQTTQPIPYNATAAAVQTALTNLSSIGPGNVSVLAPAPGGPYTVTVLGSGIGGSALQVTGTGNLTPASALLTVINQGGAANYSAATPLSQLSLAGVQSDFPVAGGFIPGGIEKLGSQRLILQGPGTYTGNVNLHQGVVLLQNSTGLGSGVGTTTVLAGTALEVANSIAPNNGGVISGLEIPGEQLVLNGTGNTTFGDAPLTVLSNTSGFEQVLTLTGAVAGGVAPTQITLSFGSDPVTGNPITTPPITWTGVGPTDALNIQTALNNLTTIGGTVGGSVSVRANPTDTAYTIVFGGTLAGTPLPVNASVVTGTPGTATFTASGGPLNDPIVPTQTLWRGLFSTNPDFTLNTSFTVAFQGTLANLPLPTMTVFNPKLQGTNPSINVATTTQGGTSVYAVQTAGQTFNAVQTITFGGNITGNGSFQLAFNGLLSPPINWTSNAALLQTRIQAALDTMLGANNTVVSPPTGITIKVQPNLTGQAESGLIVTGVVDDGSGFSTPTFNDGTDLNLSGAGEVMLAGSNTYRGTTNVGANMVLTAASNQALGFAGLAETQQLAFTGAVANATQITLSFKGVSTGQIQLTSNPTTDASAIQAALMNLPTIAGQKNLGGLVQVTPPATFASNEVFTVTFGGSLFGFNQPQLSAGTNGVGTLQTTTVQDGAGAVVVANGGSLQLQGDVTISGKPLLVQGSGVSSAPNVPQHWFAVGPAPISQGQTAGNNQVTGRINSVVVDPSDPNTIYIATAGGGAWKTIDGGATWRPLFDGIAEVQQIVLTGATPYATEFTLAASGNSGDTTAPILYTGTPIDAMNIQNALNSLLSIGGAGGFVGVNQTGNGVYTVTYSGGTLNGQSVVPLTPSVTVGSGQMNVTITTNAVGSQVALYAGAITLDPSHPQTVFLGTGDTNNSPDSYYGTGVYESTDSGAHWTLLTGNAAIVPTSNVGTIVTAGCFFSANSNFIDTFGSIPANLQVGMTVTGALIPPNTTVVAIGVGAANRITISNPTTGGNLNGEAVTFTTAPVQNSQATTANPFLGKGVSSMVFDPGTGNLYVADGDGGSGANEIQQLTLNGFSGALTNANPTHYQITFDDGTGATGTNPQTTPVLTFMGATPGQLDFNDAAIIQAALDNLLNIGGNMNGGLVIVTPVQVGRNNPQVLTLISPSSGPNPTVFTLSFQGATTGPITYTGNANTDQTNIQNALNALPTIGGVGGNVFVRAMNNDTVFQIFFGGSLGGFRGPQLPLLVISPQTAGSVVAGGFGGGGNSVVFNIQFLGSLSQSTFPLLFVDPPIPHQAQGVLPPDWNVTEVVQGGPTTVINGTLGSPMTGDAPGVYSINPSQNATANLSGAWFDLTDVVSPDRGGVPTANTQDPVINTATMYPGTPGPDDEYRVSFPQSNATWSSLALTTSRANNQTTLYAALGTAKGTLNNGVFHTFITGNNEDNTRVNPFSPEWLLGSTRQGNPLVPTPDAENADEFPGAILPTTAPTIGIVTDGNIKISATNATLPLFMYPTAIPNPNNLGQYTNDPTVYALVANGSGGLQGIFVSPNGGAEWYPIPSLPPVNGDPLSGQGGFKEAGFYDASILVDPNNAQILWVAGQVDNLGTGTGQIWQSVNGGTTWTDISVDGNGNGPHTEQHAIAIDSAGNLYFGSDGGIWKLNGPLGNNPLYTDLNGNLTITQINSVATNPTAASGILAGYPSNPTQPTPGILIGSQMNGVERYDVTSGTWTNVLSLPAGLTLNGGQVAFDPQDASIAYAMASDPAVATTGGLYQSTTGGTTWNPTPLITLNSGVKNQTTFPFLIDPLNPNRLIAGGNTNGANTGLQGTGLPFTGVILAQSLDGGQTWINLGFNLPASLQSVTALARATYQGQYLPDPSFLGISDLGVNSPDPNTLYITDGTNIFVTKNDGQTWADRTTNTALANLGHIVQLVVDPTNRNTVYAIRSAFGGGGAGQVYQSTDAGQSWTNISGNLPNVPAWSLVIDPRTGNLFVGTDEGVYVSPNQGTSWSLFGTGLPNVQVRSLELNQITNTLTAGTYGRGVYQVNLDFVQGAQQLLAFSGAVTAPVATQFSVSFNGVRAPGTITYSGSPLTDAAAIQAALAALPNVGGVGGTVTVTPNSNDTAFTIVFGNTLAGTTLPVSVTVSTTTATASVAPSSGGAFTGVSGSSTWTGPVVLGGDTSFGADGTQALFNGISAAQVSITGTISEANPGTTQHVTLSGATGGTFTLTFNGQTTAALPYNASAAAVQTALTNLSNIGPGGVTVSAAAGGPYTIRFNGALGTVPEALLVLGTSSLTAGPGVTVTGTVTEAKVTKVGQGTVVLSGSNVYSGQTEVQTGVLEIDNPLALQGFNTIIDSGAALYLESSLLGEQVTLDGDGIPFNGHYTGALRNVNHNNTYTGTLTLATNSTIGVDTGSSLTIGDGLGNGSISGAFNLVKELTGTLTLDDANSFGSPNAFVVPNLLNDPANVLYPSGFVIAQGAVLLQNGNALGIAGNTTTVLDGAQLQLQAIQQVLTLSSAVSAPAGAATQFFLSFNGSSTQPITYSGNPATDASAIQAALNNLPAISGVGGSVSVTADPTDTVFTVTFGGNLAGSEQPVLVPTITQSPATAVISGITVPQSQSLRLSGSGNSNTGALLSLGGSNVWQGSITLAQDPGFSFTTTPAATVAIGVAAASVADPKDRLTITGTIGQALQGLPTSPPTFLATLPSMGLDKVGTGLLVLNPVPVTSLTGNANKNRFITGLASTSGLEVGMLVTAPNNPGLIPANTTITAISSPTQITLSSATTAVAAGVPLTFAGNTYLGGTTVDAGTLRIQQDQALGANGNAILVNSGGGLQLDANGAATGLSFAQSLTLNGTGTSYGLTVGMPVTGPGIPAGSTITAINGQTITLSLAATASGTGVTLQFPGFFPVLTLPGNTTAGSAVITGLPINGGALENFRGNNTWTGGITLASNSNIAADSVAGNATTLTVTGIIQDPVPEITFPNTTAASLTKVGSGTVVLNPAPVTSLTGDLSSSTFINNLPSTSALVVGMLVTGAGIPANTTITAISSPTQIIISNAATATQGSVPLTFVGNTYAGATIVNQGVLNVQTNLALGVPVNAVQTVTVTGPLTSVFTLNFNGFTTAPLQVGSTAQTVQSALNSLPSISAGGGSVTVSYSAGTGVYTVTFNGGPLAGNNQPTLVGQITVGRIAVNVAVDGSHGTTVNSGGTLQLQGGLNVATEALTLNGGTLENVGGTSNTWGGTVTLASLSNLKVDSSGDMLTMAGAIGDQGNKIGVNLVGPGTVLYAGTASNTYTGQTWVQSGTLQLNMAPGAFALAGNNIGQLTVGTGNGSGATVIDLASGQLDPSGVNVTVNSDGLFDLNSQKETVAQLQLNDGTLQTRATGTLTVNQQLVMTGGSLVTGGAASSVALTRGLTASADAAGNAATISGGGSLVLTGSEQFQVIGPGKLAPRPDLTIGIPIIESSAGSGFGLDKEGSGILELTAANTFTGTTTITQGTLLADAPTGTTLGAVALTGGTVGGIGTIGSLTTTTTGTIQPGNFNSPYGTGTLTIASSVTLTSSDTLSVNLGNPGATNLLKVIGTLTETSTPVITGTTDPAVPPYPPNTTQFTIATATVPSVPTLPGSVAYVNNQAFSVAFNPTTIVLTRILTPVNVTLTANPSGTAVFQQQITLSVMVTPTQPGIAPPNGFPVTFQVDGSPLGQPVNTIVPQGSPSAVANLTVTLPVGTHTITASFNGQSQFTTLPNTPVPTVVLVVNPAPTTTTVVASNLAVVGAGLASGGSGYSVGDTLKVQGGTFASSAQLQVTAVGVGSAFLSAGGTGYQVGDTLTLTGGTFTTPATLKVTAVNAGTGAITGFTIASAGSYTTLPASPGVIDQTTSAASGAAFSLTSTVTAITVSAPGAYSTVPANPVSVADVTTPTASGATFTLATNPAQLVFGEPVTLVATVAASGSSTGQPTGSVDFFDTTANQDLGSQPLSPGTSPNTSVATLTTSSLSVATHAIKVTYTTDGNYAGSNGPLSLVIGQDSTTTTITPTPASSTLNLNQNVTFNVQVTANAPGNGTPTGTITFKDGPNVLSTQSLSNGTASYSTSSLQPGSHSITASYSGDTNDASSNASTPNFTVVKILPTITMTLSPTGSLVVGQPVTLTATITVPQGTIPLPANAQVTFLDNNVVVGNAPINSSGVALFLLSQLPSISNLLVASYPGDASHQAVSVALNNATPVPAAAASTTTSLASSAGLSFPFGQNVTYTATVTSVPPSASTPNGTVTFEDGGVVLGTGTLNASGQATFSTANLNPGLGVGPHSITAIYNNDGSNANYIASTSNTLSQVVTGNSVTTLTITPSSPGFGQPVLFTATVTGPSTNSVIPTGMITFLDGTIPVGTKPLDGTGTASFSTSNLLQGTHSITARYSGDSNYSVSSSSPTSLTVSQGTTTTTLDVSPNVALTAGQPVTLTATVSINFPTSLPLALNQVIFQNNGVTLGSAPLNATTGVAILNTSLPAGSNSLTATFPGDTNYAGSVSTPQAISVSQADTQASLTASPSGSSLVNQLVTFTATISSLEASTSVPTGPVIFEDDTGSGPVMIGSGPLDSSGVATFSTAKLSQGPHSITAVYGGDANFLGTSSAPLSQMVGQASTTLITFLSPNPVTYGQSVTFNVKVTGSPSPTPTGTITFMAGSVLLDTRTLSASGQASDTVILTQGVNVGIQPITANYSGDAFYAASIGTTQLTVNASPTTTVLSPSSSSGPAGTSPNITATVTNNGSTTVPVGSVTFTAKGPKTFTQVVALDGNGQAVFSLTTLPQGKYSVSAAFTGASNPGGKTVNSLTSTAKAVSYTVTQAASSTGLSVAPSNPTLLFGQTVTLTATVTANGNPVTSGSVTFKDGSTTLGTVNLNAAGTATFSSTSLAVGNHSFTAQYNGGAFAASTSSASSLTIGQTTPNVALTSSLPLASANQSVTFTATVSNPNGPGAVTGTVTFMDGSTAIPGGSAVKVNSAGVATFSTSKLSFGNHTITAVFNANSNFLSATSNSVPEQIAGPTTTKLSASATSFTAGTAATLTATVTSTSGPPTGTVTFTFNGGNPQTVSLDTNGQAVLPLNTLTSGTFKVTAQYNGAAPTFGGSSSNTVTLNVLGILNHLSSGTAGGTYGSTFTIPGGTIQALDSNNLLVSTYNSGARQVSITADANNPQGTTLNNGKPVTGTIVGGRLQALQLSITSTTPIVAPTTFTLDVTDNNSGLTTTITVTLLPPKNRRS